MANKILIIEDDITLLHAYNDVFTAEGFETMMAANGQEGLEAVKTFHPDIILLDLLMPVINGEEFLKRLTGDHKVIVFSNIDRKITDPNIKRYLPKSTYTPRQVVNIAKEVLSV